MALPLILAGPILRRVDPTSVSVWIALSRSARVEVSIFKGRVSDLTSSRLFSIPAPPPHAADAQTLRVGAQLHVTVVTVTTSGSLDAGQVYSYLVKIDANDDLKSEGFLDFGTDAFRPNLPLGYAPGFLPSFVAPPDNPEDLVILHASCRKMHGADVDAMTFADGIVSGHPLPPLRPHQLVLTGDQIYADEVPAVLLWKLTQLGNELLGVDESININGTVTSVNRITLPPGSRQSLINDHAKLTSTAAASHLLSFGEYCAMYLMAWSNALWPDHLADKSTVFPDNPPKPPHEEFLDPVGTGEDDYDAELSGVREVRDRLPQVRRVLANIPVLMVLDDHEITDDFYLSGRWKTRALDPQANTLGRAIIRNGLAAFAIFQAWGNDPRAFDSPKPGFTLLQTIRQLFPAPPQTSGVYPISSAASALESQLGFDGAATVRWDCIVERPNYRFIVLDTRTRRSYKTPRSSPGLLSSDALADQIPPALAPLPLTIIVSAAPVIGLPLHEDVFQPAYARILDAVNALQFAFTFDWTTDAGQMGADLEAWACDHPAFETLLERLYDLENVVMLGGDVHFAFTTSLTYWKNGNPRRFAQLTSSAAKNPWPGALFYIFKSVVGQNMFEALLRRTEKLGWHQPVTITVPTGDFAFPHTLSDTPAVVNPESLPPGTVADRHWDWSWRLKVEIDSRPEFDGTPRSRPPTTKPAPIPLDQALPPGLIPFYNGVAAWCAEEVARAARVAAWPSNIGRLSFNKNNGQLSVEHSILFVNPFAQSVGQVEPNIVHTIPIGTVVDPNEPRLR